MRAVQDPDLHKNIVELNFVQNLKIEGTKVSFDLRLTTPACPIRDPAQNLRYCTVLSALNHSYWIVGVVVGAVVVCALGHVVDPERIRAWTNGMEFSMAALFLVIFTDQMQSMAGRSSGSAIRF